MSRYVIVGTISSAQVEVFRILAVDPVKTRLRDLRIYGFDYTLTLADNYSDFVQALEEGHFDIVLATPFYFGTKAELGDIVTPLIMAHKRGKVKGVLLHATSYPDGVKQLKELRAAGVPSAYYPYMWSTPGNHVETKIDYDLAKPGN